MITMGLQGEKTADWFQRGRKVLVNGVSSGFRYWGDDDTIVVDHGEGAYVYDMDGNRYIDYHLGFGPVILGHGHPVVAAAVAEAAAEGTTFAMTTRREIEAAEKVKAAVGYIDALRFTNTGTEATLHAIRLARAATGREIIVKFEGAYHGAHDNVLFSTAGATVSHLGSRRSPVPLQALERDPRGGAGHGAHRPLQRPRGDGRSAPPRRPPRRRPPGRAGPRKLLRAVARARLPGGAAPAWPTSTDACSSSTR